MVKFILGAKGVGKTKCLIDGASRGIQERNGNIAFVDVDHDHIFTLNYNVRLINAMEFNIKDIESFYGFLCGLVAMDYDIEKVYIDSIYKVVDLSISDLQNLLERLTLIGERFDTEFYINVDYMLDDIPEHLKVYCTEIEMVEGGKVKVRA